MKSLLTIGDSVEVMSGGMVSRYLPTWKELSTTTWKDTFSLEKKLLFAINLKSISPNWLKGISTDDRLMTKRKSSIIIVGDGTGVTGTLANLLDDLGCNVDVVSDDYRALEMMGTKPYDVVIFRPSDIDKALNFIERTSIYRV